MQGHSSFFSLVSTAVVDIVDKEGKAHTCRVLLDNDSQSHYITKSMASLLKLPIIPVNIAVTGLNLKSSSIQESVVTTIKSRFNKFEKRLDFLVVPHITSRLPSIPIPINFFQTLPKIQLADPTFFKPSEVDALLGVQLFYKLLCTGQMSIKGHDAILQKTHLGWIIAGNILHQQSNTPKTTCHLIINSHVSEDDELTKFWKIENVPVKQFLSKEQACESHFLENVTRNKEGRYIVRLPFNGNKEKLGCSFNVALKRFNYLENKFKKNSELKKSYSEFLNEYLNLNHMCLDSDLDSQNKGFFLPHHAVVKNDSLSTKTRVKKNYSR